LLVEVGTLACVSEEGAPISDETGSEASISGVSLVRFSDLSPSASGDAQRLFELVDMMNISSN